MDGSGWIWPYHGVRTPQGLFLFLLQIEAADGPAGFGFKLVSTWVGKVADPEELPERWVMKQQRIPWGHAGRVFGSAVMVQGDTCYIYGTTDDTSSGITVEHVIVGGFRPNE